MDVVGDGGVRRTEREVAEVGLAIGVEQHAVTADSTVHDPLLGRRHERPTDPSHERRQRGVRQRTAAQPVGERPAVNPPHHDVRRARLPPVVVDRDDRGMAQRGHAKGADLEGADELRAVGDLLADHPDRELAVDPGQAGGEHRAVAAGAEPLTQAVPAQRQPGLLAEHEARVVREHRPFEVRQRG